MKVDFDKVTAEWCETHRGAEFTVMQCGDCGLFYKPSLGHKCKMRKEEIKIKPCPFCGSSNVQKSVSSGGRATSFRCKSCGAYVDFWDCGMPTEFEVVEAWNRRAK